jgi:tetratricopeptide (TPR) repeat protein
MFAFSLLLAVPAFAVTLKRLNDRGHSIWIAALWIALAAFGMLLAAFEDFSDPMAWSRTQWLLLSVLGIMALWFLIDLGMLRGERGPNRHGPDPLAPAAVSAPVTRRRTLGENIRDGVTGLAALLALIALAAPQLGISGLPYRAIRSVAMPASLQLWEARRANEPAWQAQREGDKAYRDRDYEGAIRRFSEAIELYGAHNAAAALSFRTRAFARERLGERQAALADHDRAIALEPDFTAGYRYRGILLAELGRHQDALNDFRAALEQNKDSPETLIARGREFEKVGRHEDALNDFGQAAVAARNVYEKSVANRDKEEWRERMRKDRDGLIARAHAHRGNVMRTLGRVQEALAEYARALELRADDAWIYTNRGWLYEQQKQTELARQDYEKAASLRAADDWLKRALDRTNPAR